MRKVNHGTINRGSRSCRAMDSILSVQNKDFTGDGKECTKMLRTVAKKTTVIYADSSSEPGKSCEDLLWHHRTSTLYCSETNGFAERAVTRVKEGTSAVLLQSGLDEKMVVWLYGMLLPSAKCPRPPGRRENSVWKAIWRTIQRTNTSFWSNGWSSSGFNARFIKTFSIWQESTTSYLSWLWADRGWNLEMRCYDSRIGRSGKVGRIRNFLSLENQRERGIDNTKRRWIHNPSSRWYENPL